MSAQGIYIIKAIDDESMFDTLCDTLEDFGVDIVSPKPFDISSTAHGESELILASTEDVLEDLKEELESMDLLESANIVDSFEDDFSEEEDDEDFPDENY